MNVGGGESADQMVRMMLSGGEVAVRLTGSAMKNLLALTMALAKNNQTISGKVSIKKMLGQTRDLRSFPMVPEQYKQFKKYAKRQKILFSAIKDKDDNGKLIDVVMPVTELDRANLIFEKMLYQGPVRQAPESEGRGAPQPERGRPDPDRSPERDRRSPQRPRNSPEHQPGDSRQGEAPSKKDFRSGRDSPGTRPSSSTRSGGTMGDRPSVLGRLRDYRAQMNKQRSAPARDKRKGPKVRPKQR